MKFLIGLIIGAALVVGGAVLYFVLGFAPVATTDPTMPLEKTLANAALHARIDRDMPRSVPIQANEETYLAGAKIYDDQCAVCHGLPDGEQTAIAKGMFPKPPRLFHGKGVTDDEPGETYWKVANGIRLTGMPSFKGNLSDTQMWQVTLLLANADKISDTVKQQLKPPASGSLQMPEKTQPQKTR